MTTVQHGARMTLAEYRTVDPVSDTITVLEPAGAEYMARAVPSRNDILTTPAMPGFALPLEQLFGHPARELIRRR